MMEFLVPIKIALPDQMSDDRRAALFAAEADRAAELRAERTLARIWRVPGQTANWSHYVVSSTDALHDSLTSLPLWPWMTVDVHPLATHPAER